MSTNKVLKGVLLVGLGATSYGMLATFVKLAYADTSSNGLHYTPAEIITAQFLIGIIALLGINIYQKNRKGTAVVRASPIDIRKLLILGTSTGFTSIFYYLAVKFIPVSIGIVLLMQTVWMGVFLEMVLDKKMPSKIKMLSVLIVLFGTALATNLFFNKLSLDWRGVVLGLLAAASFTTTMYAANKTALSISSAQRSLFMLLGGAIVVLVFALLTQNTPFNFDIFYKWGILIAIFGTVIPPLLLNAGFPLTGIGLGSIVSAMELPVSVMMAYVVLGETVVFMQWIGILLIILAIVFMNIKFKSRTMI
ncbi:DMT family transporter [Flavobacterium sp.]|uniref:DMT family transporter n=1 Tax=Flavobacterium sp. TaxID=239 RepID=UPI0024874555|nr:DMT family transporter [Flavobacterium sp.]MDI1318477.1 DMT family transporter [Flavobacterium sp.]